MMLASYDSDIKKIKWFKGFKTQLPVMTEEIQTLWDTLEKDPNIKITNNHLFLEIADDLNVADEKFQVFIKTTKESGKSYANAQEALAGYEAYLKSTTKSLSLADIGTKALSASMNVLSSIGWMAAISAATWAIGEVVGWISDYIHRGI